MLVVTETWHEGPQSSSLTRATPPGYHCIDAARPIQPGAAVNTVEFQSHGGLAIMYRVVVKFQKKVFDLDISTIEYLCGRGLTRDG